MPRGSSEYRIHVRLAVFGMPNPFPLIFGFPNRSSANVPWIFGKPNPRAKFFGFPNPLSPNQLTKPLLFGKPNEIFGKPNG